MLSVIAVKRRIDKSAVRLAKQLLHHFTDGCKVRAVHKIQPLQNFPAYTLLLKDALV